jgi:hypothetical protein
MLLITEEALAIAEALVKRGIGNNQGQTTIFPASCQTPYFPSLPAACV